MRLVFAGTPEPAVPALEALIASEHEVVAVICRPDARKGRGRSLHPCPVKETALAHGIEVLSPSTLKPGSEDGEALRTRLKELAPDCLPVVAYGNLITNDLLDIAEHGWVNLHFSLLPQWRGAAPVQAAILHGDDISGASTFRIEEGLDTGPVFGSITEKISADDNADSLLERLAYRGAELLVATMDGLAAGTLRPQPQEGEASYAPKLSTEEARIKWDSPDFGIDRHIRAYTPAPGAWTTLDEQRFKIGAAKPLGSTLKLSDEEAAQLEAGLAPGVLLFSRRHVFVGTATEPLELVKVQPMGKKMMNAADWARGLGGNHNNQEMVLR